MPTAKILKDGMFKSEPGSYGHYPRFGVLENRTHKLLRRNILDMPLMLIHRASRLLANRTRFDFFKS
jgi:hypothetical protein